MYTVDTKRTFVLVCLQVEDKKMDSDRERETLLSELNNVIKDFTKEQIDALLAIIEEEVHDES